MREHAGLWTFPETAMIESTPHPDTASVPGTRGRFGSDQARWAACLVRDRSADGHFLFGVRTTGFFCRPSCAARRPQRANVRFYADAAAARRAGLRPCRRCHPEGEGQDARDAARIAQVCRLIEQAPAPVALTALAQSVGLSPFHCHRLFRRTTGMTPAAYQRARRGERLRTQLQANDSVTEAIYAAATARAAASTPPPMRCSA
jgi:AraC family transcriptional regulator of adaptative response/methylated-DNA-[protein]-cysteine methyltransferase